MLRFRIGIIVAIILSMNTHLGAQSLMRVQGVVLSAEDNRPVSRVAITQDLILKGTSDMDGKFSILVDRDVELVFNHGEYELSSYSLDGQQTIEVTISPKVVAIEDIVVVSRVKSKAITADRTDIEIKGNYFHLKTKFKVSNSGVKRDYRFVVQPMVRDLTRRQIYYLRPVVIDGQSYDVVERRYLDFAGAEDALKPYIVPNELKENSNVYPYRDSVYISSEDLDNDFLAECHMVTVTYHEPRRVNSGDATKVVTIANGTVNPLRLFDYSIAPMQLDETIINPGEEQTFDDTKIDQIHIPNPELELRNSSGAANIEFNVNRSTINYSNKRNEESIEQIRGVLKDLQHNPDAVLKSISMIGYASPEGNFDKNQELANLRTDRVFKLVTDVLEEDQLKYIELNSSGVVESWSSVVELARADNKALATKLEKILEQTDGKYGDMHYMVIRLPEYRTDIVPRYLASLRRVEYNIDYSIFRPFTYDEIKSKYLKGEEKLSRYEYYILFSGEEDMAERDVIEAKAIEDYPDYTIFVNRKAVDIILSDSVDLELLAPILDRGDAPLAVRYNQAIMALNNNELTLADSLAQGIEFRAETEYLHRVIDLFNGGAEDSYDYFAERGGLNEVLILLMMKQNKEANAKMQLLMKSVANANNARYHYVTALCANRLDDLTTAMVHLQIAITLDPSLEDMAKVDSDLLDIYEIIKADKEDTDE